MTATSLSATSPRRVPLRIGLVLAVLGSVVAAIPAVAEIGLDGSIWDVVVVALAVLCPAVAIAIIILTPLAWNGRRKPVIGVLVALGVSILTILPAFFLAPGEVPSEAIVSAVVGLVLTLGVMALIAFGARLLPTRSHEQG